jgi:hypothetical protein
MSPPSDTAVSVSVSVSVPCSVSRTGNCPFHSACDGECQYTRILRQGGKGVPDAAAALQGATAGKQTGESDGNER